MAEALRVATLNLLNDRSRWEERRRLIARGLARLALDLIALQEVTDPLGNSTAHWLADELGGYSVHVSPKTGLSRRWEGIAILSRLPVERHAILDLRSQERTAQRVEVRVGGHVVAFVNGHFHWPPYFQSARLRQIGRMLNWLGELPPEVGVVVCGDFNSTPGSLSMGLMRQHYVSAHFIRHGHEPAFTCPTPLVSGGPILATVKRELTRVLSFRRGEAWLGTLDYIFVSPRVRVVECGLILDHPAPDDRSLYASDHFGLAATLELAPADWEAGDVLPA
jgi:endonuclease/exonuclease/phosphatase family metal-dependent hydrolase